LPGQRVEFDMVIGSDLVDRGEILSFRTSLPNRFITSLGDGNGLPA